MLYGLNLEVPPVYEPVSVDELKEHLRLNIDDENSLLAEYISAARLLAEDYTGRQFMTATWKAYFDYWPDFLPKSPTQAVSEILYYDTSNVQQELTTFDLDNTCDPARLMISNKPSLGSRKPSVIITLECGYDEVYKPFPPTLKHAIMLLASDYYMHRTAHLPTLGTVRQIPYGLQAVLSHYKVHL